MGKLTATGIKNVRVERSKKLFDGEGLYLLVNPSGSKYWRYDYRYAAKRKTLSIGTYPDTSLKEARRHHKLAREQLEKGIDPSHTKRMEKLAHYAQHEDSFEAMANEWFHTKQTNLAKSTKERTRRILENDLFPVLGNRPINDISAPELLMALRRIEARGALETTHKAKQIAGMIFRYAVASGRAERDPSADIRDALKPKNQVVHRAAITEPAEVAKLLLAIDGFQGTPAVTAALKLSPLLFQRPGELRTMEWSEINREEHRWEIPAEKMKMRESHIVPLARQSIEILREIEALTGRGRYVFPSARGASRPLSDNGVRTALRTMGYSNEMMSPHGFRAMARTILDEVLDYRVDLIEAQLAHSVRDATGRAYNRTKFLPQRVDMMQGWADYLDNLRATGESENVLITNFRKVEKTL